VEVFSALPNQQLALALQPLAPVVHSVLAEVALEPVLLLQLPALASVAQALPSNNQALPLHAREPVVPHSTPSPRRMAPQTS
jgi:hypothetical protein